MKPFYEIVKKPLITEKAVILKDELGRYSFEVFLNANKPAIRQAIESFFKVKVKDIHTTIVKGKAHRVGRHTGRKANWKKALVTLEKGQKLDIFEVK